MNDKTIDNEKTSMIILDECPECHSKEVSRRHHLGDFRLPECFFNQCDECGCQWDFN